MGDRQSRASAPSSESTGEEALDMLRKIVAAILMTTMTACTTVGPVANPREFIPIKRPREVWLTRNDGTVLLMYRPTLQGDSISGVVRGEGERRIARNDIQQITAAVPAPDKTRLAVIVGGVAFLGLLGAALAIASTTPAPFNPCDIPENEC
jgi:hypothetical protein